MNPPTSINCATPAISRLETQPPFIIRYELEKQQEECAKLMSKNPADPALILMHRVLDDQIRHEKMLDEALEHVITGKKEDAKNVCEQILGSENLNYRAHKEATYFYNLLNEDKGSPELTFLNLSVAAAGNNGRTNAEYLLGNMYLLGVGVEQSDDKAAEFFIRAAEHNNQHAEKALNAMFLLGRGINPVTSRCALWQHLIFQKSALSQFQINVHFNGILLKPAVLMLIEAVEDNHPYALSDFMDLFFYSQQVRDCLDTSTVEKYLKKAAEELMHPQAMYVYAEMSSKQKYDFTARTSIPKIIASNYNALSAEGARILTLEIELQKGNLYYAFPVGFAYFFGANGIQPDYQKAVSYLTLAANNDHPIAAHLVAEMHENFWASTPGIFINRPAIVSKEPEKNMLKYRQIAIDGNYLPAVLEKNAANGDAEAAFTLYGLHLSGETFLSLLPNKDKAMKFLYMAAEGKHKEAKDFFMQLSNQGEVKGSAPLAYYQTEIEKLKETGQEDINHAAMELKNRARAATAAMDTEKTGG